MKREEQTQRRKRNGDGGSRASEKVKFYRMKLMHTFSQALANSSRSSNNRRNETEFWLSMPVYTAPLLGTMLRVFVYMRAFKA